MIKKGILLFCFGFLLVGALFSNQTLATASVVFRAIKQSTSPIVPAEAHLAITPNSDVISTSSYNGMILWDINNNVLNFETRTVNLFDWEFSANSYTPVTLRFIISPLRLKTNASKIINFDLGITVDSSTMGPFFLYDNSGVTDSVEHYLDLSSLVTTSSQIGFIGQITNHGNDDYLKISKTDGSSTYEKKPYIEDLLSGVTVIEEPATAVASVSIQKDEVLEISFTLQSSHWDDINKEKEGHVFPLNINATRRGTGSITLEISDVIEYGEYLTQMYVELEVQ